LIISLFINGWLGFTSSILQQLDKNMKHKCPVCQKTINISPQKQPEESKFFPFCSQRCKLIDLGAWLDGKYKIISESQSQKQEFGELPDTSSDEASDNQ
jgi:endogenous inhibitor of DNA gyrase (YacG/DUF329 family)